MIELTANIGDNRRCSLTIWKSEDWQALGMTPGLPQPSRIQDYTARGRVIGQSHYFLIEELPRLLAWLAASGRPYRLKDFNEVTPPSPDQIKARLVRQQQLDRVAEATALKASKLAGG